MNVVDTSGWIEFLFEGNNADVFAPLIEDEHGPLSRRCTPGSEVWLSTRFFT